jgi:hypothetical protein
MESFQPKIISLGGVWISVKWVEEGDKLTQILCKMVVYHMEKEDGFNFKT